MEEDGYETELVPGITSFCAAAARVGIPLCEWNEPLHVMPALHKLGDDLSLPGNYVLMKSGSHMAEVKEILRKSGRDVNVVENCGMPNEKVYRGVDEETIASLDASYEAQRAGMVAAYNQDLLNLWSQSIKDSDLGDAFEGVAQIAQQFRSGEITGTEAAIQASDLYGRDGGMFDPSTLDNLARSLGTAVSAMGGEQEMLRTIETLQANGNTELAGQLADFLSMSMIANDFRETTRADAEKYRTQETAGLYQQAVGTLTSGYDAEQGRLELMRFREENGLGTELENYITRLATAPASAQGAEQAGMSPEMLSTWQGIVDGLKSTYDFDAAAERIGQPFVAEGAPARDDIISYQLLEGTLAEEADAEGTYFRSFRKE